ncbi:uncharacterized protein EI90DRAFT_3129688 [Cantharellus anzutake]|uniref:uncharacterized protein n=1 Tax=Cantharellus anzutake TaxID=1750568 RepID=UPI00190445FC|nr:uncharacterized protein EI90DRAFT_3129688 [Cantharellus anzutake]KAF8324717.1 hypothetical protein EI90DRAFT_3129688 [Cantharellus anzutake]
MPTAHQPSVDCAASNPNPSSSTAHSDANALPAVVLPHSQMALSTPLTLDLTLPTLALVPPTPATLKNCHHRQGRKKRQSEQHSSSPSLSVAPNPSSISSTSSPLHSGYNKSCFNLAQHIPFPILTYAAVAGKKAQLCISFPILATPDARPQGWPTKTRLGSTKDPPS